MHDPTVYVVAWDSADLIKAGYSSNRRWRTFENRGARLIQLVTFTDIIAAITLETVIEAVLAGCSVPLASRAESVPFLGPNGCGWKECRRMNTAEGERIIRQAIRQAIRDGSADGVLHDSHAGFLRTYGRTNGRRTNHPLQPNFPLVTRTRAYSDFRHKRPLRGTPSHAKESL